MHTAYYIWSRFSEVGVKFGHFRFPPTGASQDVSKSPIPISILLWLTPTTNGTSIGGMIVTIGRVVTVLLKQYCSSIPLHNRYWLNGVGSETLPTTKGRRQQHTYEQITRTYVCTVPTTVVRVWPNLLVSTAWRRRSWHPSPFVRWEQHGEWKQWLLLLKLCEGSVEDNTKNRQYIQQ